jgi:hypothetical protein
MACNLNQRVTFLPEYPNFEINHELYITKDERLTDALSDACTLLSDSKCGNVAKGMFVAFRDGIMSNLEISLLNLQRIDAAIEERMATTSDMQSYKSQLADLALYGITSTEDLNYLLGHQNPTMHSDYVYTALLYKTSEDISGHENWCLSNTFTEELLVEAYEILSTNYGDTMIHEKFNSELICRVLFFTLQKFSRLRIQAVNRRNASKLENTINGLSPLAYEVWEI